MTDARKPDTKPARHRKHRTADTDAPAAAAPPAAADTEGVPSARPLGAMPIHVRWHDLDAFNHVNNASYLVFLEEARLQWLRTISGEWFHAHAVPVTAAVELRYLKPITWPAEIDVQRSCEKIGTSSITIRSLVIRRDDPSCVHAEARVVLVWIDPATNTPVPLPEAIRAVCGP